MAPAGAARTVRLRVVTGLGAPVRPHRPVSRSPGAPAWAYYPLRVGLRVGAGSESDVEDPESATWNPRGACGSVPRSFRVAQRGSGQLRTTGAPGSSGKTWRKSLDPNSLRLCEGPVGGGSGQRRRPLEEPAQVDLGKQAGAFSESTFKDPAQPRASTATMP